ncbi:TetR/AcrR family transcriptional regulator [Catenuloplanes atrovinosus]|uniref:AcrR family transcriptional regulator n=1 Tax=Catenuloplanes atrovinosus TaxID=137266 RepID=A0AAE3YPE7_9ACTN|nr:helix-turn-helix domain-containing protein [Catenuloplanes atrovinosus]MDR7275451.1 AcrR family transcriptional regulator [Catenuloplanes atrovinosus]
MARSDAARTALLDTAERLFAEHGIAQVSDRRVAEVAGNTNHSAVRYYFGGREGLLRELVGRHARAIEERCVPATSDSVLADVRALVVPSMEVLAALPRPSWRARFIGLAVHEPGVRDLVRDTLTTLPVMVEIRRSLRARLAGLDPDVVAGRAAMIGLIVTTATAEIEARAERDGSAPRWLEAGDFLADAIAGMLTAPVTRSGRLNPLAGAR